jgi:hypothetical protein
MGVAIALLLVLGSEDLNAKQKTQLAMGVQENLEIPTDGQFMSMANGVSVSDVTFFFPAIEVRFDGLPSDLFAYTSYGWCVASREQDFFGISLRASLASIGLGMNIKIGWATFAPRLGLSYSSWEYQIQYEDETHPSIHNSGAGLLLGGQISASVTTSIEIKFGYDFLLRSPWEYSGEFPDAGGFTISQNGKDNIFSMGIAYWIL